MSKTPSPWPTIVRRGQAAPARPRDASSTEGRPLHFEMGGNSSREAQRNAADIMQRVRDAIRRGDEGIRELGELVLYFGEDLVLKMPEVHDYLRHLERKQPSAVDRILGGGRGRPRANHLGTVIAIDTLIEDEGCSVAEAARILASGRLKNLNMSPRSIENAYHRHKEHEIHQRRGIDVPGGHLLDEPWSRSDPR